MSHYYTRDLNPQCQGKTGYCRKPATVEVFNTYNATMGKFCARCGKDVIHEWKLRDLQYERQKNADADQP